MRKTVLGICVAVAVLALAGAAFASPIGWIDTERFGYNGTILNLQTNETVSTGDRDVAIWSDSSDPLDPVSVVMGSWWYSIEPEGSGWGNINGNTGPGFMQYYDLAQDYVTSQSYGFADFNGTYWNAFSFFLDVSMAENGAYSRLSAPSNTGDSGYFQSLQVSLTATGLQGEQVGDWIVAEESDAFATNVTGSISGTFVNTSATAPENNGTYDFLFNITMDNWAYENRDDLTAPYDEFYSGSFGAYAPVPEPASMALLGIGLAGLAVTRARKKRNS